MVAVEDAGLVLRLVVGLLLRLRRRRVHEFDGLRRRLRLRRRPRAEGAVHAVVALRFLGRHAPEQLGAFVAHTLWSSSPEFQHSSGISRGYTNSKMPQPSFDAKWVRLDHGPVRRPEVERRAEGRRFALVLPLLLLVLVRVAVDGLAKVIEIIAPTSDSSTA